MRLRFTEKTIALLMVALIITSAFIPAVSAIKPANSTQDTPFPPHMDEMHNGFSEQNINQAKVTNNYNLTHINAPENTAETFIEEKNYIPAVDERQTQIRPQETELVEGVDYGEFTYNETPDWIIGYENETNNPKSTDSLRSSSIYAESLAATSGIQYQAVSNGDFSRGLVDWTPNSGVHVDYGGGTDYVIDIGSIGAPHCLVVDMKNFGQRFQNLSCRVAQANIDMTGVDEISYRYNFHHYMFIHPLLESKVQFYIDDEQRCMDTASTQYPPTPPFGVWLFRTVDVSNYSGMHNISFFFDMNATNPYISRNPSHIVFLIDGVSACSTQKPAGPDEASVRFFVRDSQTNTGVGSAQIYCNNEVRTTDDYGYTNDFFLNASGTYEYHIEAEGYWNHSGFVSATLGNATVTSETINKKPILTGEIEILSPLQDNYAGENITLSGCLKDIVADTVQISHNGSSFSVPVSNSNFSAELELGEINSINITAVNGNLFCNKEILLDGDHLWCSDEVSLGFDPLDPDSDCTQTEANEAGNGVPDGYELLDGELPVFSKLRAGYDPFLSDSDGDGLNDSFELLKLGIIQSDSTQSCQTLSVMSDSSSGGVSDDPDGDGLSNIDEQTYGTNPLSADTDDDGINDPDEIQAGLNPLAADGDSDLLPDGFEVKIGSSPMVADNGSYHHLTDSYFSENVTFDLYGPAFALKEAGASKVNYSHLISDEILVSGVYDIDYSDDVECQELSIRYDDGSVTNTSDLSVFMFDDDLKTFVQIPSNLSASGDSLTCSPQESSKYAVLVPSRWNTLFDDSGFRTQAVMSCSSPDISSIDDQYFSAINESVPLIDFNSTVLTEGVDFGAVSCNLTDEERAALESPVTESSDYQPEMAIMSDSDEVRYQAVSNGDFSSGMNGWSPSGSVSYSGAGYGHEIDTYNSDYTSSPRCLSIDVWNNGRTDDYHSYEVAHANVDLTGVDALTYNYKCENFIQGSGLTASRLEFRIDGSLVYRYPNYGYPSTSAGWRSASIDVSGYSGVHTISYRAYLTFQSVSSLNTHSNVQFLIDDVSAWSVQQLAGPNTASVRFFVRDSQTNEGVNSASVTCDSKVKYTDYNGYTNDFFLNSNGTYAYQIVKDGYNTKEGIIRATLGDTKTAYAVINANNAPTGNIHVNSDPNNAEIYIDSIYYGNTNKNIYDILAGSHAVEVRKDGYYSASQTVQISSGQTANVNFNLTQEAGSIQVTSSPAGATVLVDGQNAGITSPSSGILTLNEIPTGEHQVKVIKDGYAPYICTASVVKDETTYITAGLPDDDLEEDGLLDYYEENGYTDGFGNRHTTDPGLTDTDGDGLSDGYEAGEPITDENGNTYFKQRSDPTKADTDADGLDDYLEDAIESDPLCADTDGDGLSDYEEWNTTGTDLWSSDTDSDGYSDYEEHLNPDYDPLVYEKRLSSAEMGCEFVLGGVLGEWGADDHDSIYYLGGWLGSGVLLIGDLRDIGATISGGDWIGTGLNLAALIPAYGDAAKAAATVGTFVAKNPAMLKPAMVLLGGVAPQMDTAAEAISAIRKAHGDEVINRLLVNGITEDELKVVVRSNGDLLKTLAVTKRSDGKVIWLEEGKLGSADDATSWIYDKGGSGWAHIVNNHIENPSGNQFLSFGSQYTDKSKIRELIVTGVKNGIEVKNGIIQYLEPNSNKVLQIVIGSNGYIVTASKLKDSKVLI